MNFSLQLVLVGFRFFGSQRNATELSCVWYMGPFQTMTKGLYLRYLSFWQFKLIKLINASVIFGKQ